MTGRPFRAACLQLTPGNDLTLNLAEIGTLVARAAASGAEWVLLPEFATYLDRSSASMRASASRETDSVALKALQALARDHSLWLLIGSIAMLTGDEPTDPMVNRSFLIAPDGGIVARYDKIHLFDATLADGQTVGESRHYRGGATAVVVDTPLGRIGLSVCYDLRFPQLYRALALASAQILVIPAAFTAETGAAHWEPLLRARAIETGCYVLAPATTGTHPGDWHTYGHSMIIDPWGAIVAQGVGESGMIVMAEIDPASSQRARSRITSLNCNPSFSIALTRHPA